MATPILKTLPQHITPTYLPTGSIPDSVDWGVTPAGVGTLTPDTDPRTGATFMADPALPVGPVDVSFSATAHQGGLPDLVATVDGTLTDVVVPVSEFSLALDPQTGVLRGAAATGHRGTIRTGA